MVNSNLPVTSKTRKAFAELALRQQEPDYARLVMVAPSGSCEISPPIQILRLPDVIKRVGLCRASIYSHMALGIFPQSISLGARAVGWIEHEIDAWLIKRMQVRKSRCNSNQGV